MTKNLNIVFDGIIQKARRDKDGKMHIIGVASDNFEDTRDDAISEHGLEIMKNMANEGVDVLETHTATFSIGTTDNGTLLRDADSSLIEFMVDIVLDESFPQSTQLFKAVSENSEKHKMSVGLAVDRTNPEAILYREGSSGQMVRVLNEFALDHIAITRETTNSAINQRARFLSAIKKSIDLCDPTDFEKKVLDKDSKSSLIDDNSNSIDTNEEVMADTTVESGVKSTTVSDLIESITAAGVLGKTLARMGFSVKSEDKIEDTAEVVDEAVESKSDTSEDVAPDDSEVVEEVTDESSVEDDTDESVEEKSEDADETSDPGAPVEEEDEDEVEEKSDDVADETVIDVESLDAQIEALKAQRAELVEAADEEETEEKSEDDFSEDDSLKAGADAFRELLDSIKSVQEDLTSIGKSIADQNERLTSLENTETPGGDDGVADTVHTVTKSDKNKNVFTGMFSHIKHINS